MPTRRSERRNQPRPPAVARVLERVTATARKHGMFEAGHTVLVACSGGPDSTCLLHSLHALRRLFRIRVEAFHFDHGLRPDSAADAAYVRRQADRLGVPIVFREAVDRPRKGQSVEAWARLARYAALTQAAADQGAHAIALGHTAGGEGSSPSPVCRRWGASRRWASRPSAPFSR